MVFEAQDRFPKEAVIRADPEDPFKGKGLVSTVRTAVLDHAKGADRGGAPGTGRERIG
jgi:hypothetical protein